MGERSVVVGAEHLRCEYRRREMTRGGGYQVEDGIGNQSEGGESIRTKYI